MKRFLLLVVLVLLPSSCGDQPAPSTKDHEEKVEDLSALDPEGVHKRAADTFTELIERISERQFAIAYALLDDALRKVWLEEAFVEDMKIVRGSPGGTWKTELTSSYLGQSRTGPYLQAAYTVENPLDSAFHIQCTASQRDGTFKTVQIISRVPYGTGTSLPESAVAASDLFLGYLGEPAFDSARELIKGDRIGQDDLNFARDYLESLRSDGGEIQRYPYRMLINGTWYDALRISSTSDALGFSYLELVLLQEGNDHSVVALSGRGATQ